MSLLRDVLDMYRQAQERDKRFINQFDISLLNNLLWPLYVGFICLCFLDLYSTLVAMQTSGSFRELNPIAATLFGLQFRGFLLATIFKYLPVIPYFYVVFAKGSNSEHQLEIRTVKFAALVALVASDLLLLYIVGINNIPQLAKLAVTRP